MAMVRAILCRDGADRMRDDAEEAIGTIASTSVFRPQALLLRGISLYITGEPEAADDAWSDAADEAVALHATNIAVIALSERAALALGRNDRALAGELVTRCEKVRDSSGLAEYGTSALSFAVVSLIVAPIPCRLLRTPRSSIPIQ